MPSHDRQPELKISVRNLNLYYGAKQASHDISINMPENKVTSLIGPSGCGKTTFLRSLNRMNELIGDVTIEGQVMFDDVDIYDRRVDVVELRKRVGMIFQKSNPFPMHHCRRYVLCEGPLATPARAFLLILVPGNRIFLQFPSCSS